ncbi:unnamed protein product [Cylindrotheca closterium]|uniref:RNI-like protein n=1 Tax=Cylindrotheca closterium TaxID=2856 RepID=A0AAD2G6W8_9STRA|nr:unnamed protein product [Cylindrotheca closterium]
MLQDCLPNLIPGCFPEVNKLPLKPVRLSESSKNTMEHPYRAFEDHGMRGNAHGSNVHRVTQRLVTSLESNATLQELTLNVQAISESLEFSGPIVRFLNENKSLERLQIRVPPQTKGSSIFANEIICPSLKELTIWVASDRSTKRQIDFMRKAAVKRRRLCRCHNPIRTSRSTTNITSSVSTTISEDLDQFNLRDIARFIASQPQLEYVRVQTSTLSTKQWNDLVDGIHQNRSVRHVEFRRLEGDSFSMRKLQQHPTLERIDLNGCPTIGNWHTLVSKEANIKHISWSSSPASIDCLQHLANKLSCPASSLLKLEISHTNLSGHKLAMVAAMLKENCSLREIDLSSSQLNSVDGYILTKCLQSNFTLQKLILNDNSMLKWPCDLAFLGFRDLLATPTCNLNYLDLSNNEMEPMRNDARCAEIFEGMQRNTKLKVLKLANRGTVFFETLYHKFWNESEKHHLQVSKSLGKALETCRLTELCLNHNFLDDDTIAKYLAPALSKNCRLVRLSLKRVGMGNKGMSAISKALMGNQTLEFMDISHNCDMTLPAYESLVECLPTLSKLETLWFHSNTKDELHACTLAPALVKQYALQKFSNEDCLPEMYRIFLAANRNGRRYLYQHSTIVDALWPKILARAAHNPKIVSLFVRERAEMFTYR